jgi:predicted transcriptional regulator|tara:strand:- start:12 stop:383 length:372 start_codon:yes stop_codon:yes gene_type:complete
MKVLLSIKPEFALKIFDGSKRYEYRRTIFKRDEVKKVVVYASDPIRKVIGEFEIEEIIQDNPKVLWERTKHFGGISEKRFFEYFTNKPKGYAIQVKATNKYETPLPLSSFLTSPPPQSFMYLG